MRSSSSILWGTILVIMYSLTSHAMDKKTDQELTVQVMPNDNAIDFCKHIAVAISPMPKQEIDFVYPNQASSENLTDDCYTKYEPKFLCWYNYRNDRFHVKGLKHDVAPRRTYPDQNEHIAIKCTRNFVEEGVETYEFLKTQLGRNLALIALSYTLPIMSVDALQSPRRAPATLTGWCFINRTLDYNGNKGNFYNAIQCSSSGPKIHRDAHNNLYALNTNEEAIIWDLNNGNFQMIPPRSCNSSYHRHAVQQCTASNQNRHGVGIGCCEERAVTSTVDGYVDDSSKRPVPTKYAAIVVSTANEIYQKILERIKQRNENNTCRSLFCCRRKPKID